MQIVTKLYRIIEFQQSQMKSSKPLASRLMSLLLILASAAIVGLASSRGANSTTINNCPLSEADCNSLAALKLTGSISFASDDIFAASHDFGNMATNKPSAVLFPSSTHDIAAVVRVAYLSNSHLSVSAKGTGHSIHGQAQVSSDGIVIEMTKLKCIEVFEGAFGESPYVEACGGELWVDVVNESLKRGLAPRTFTDYLHLTVGGTLSNAGISGQAFRFGPQISNVLQLQIVTGKGETVACSPHHNADLFFAALGGLGQFGIITKARILLEPAPKKVRWIRALYSDFATFTKDQEFLISQPHEQSFDYVEGSVIVNSQDSPNGWRSIPFSGQSLNATLIPKTAGPVLYTLELTKNQYAGSSNSAFNQKVSSLVAQLNYLPSLIFSSDLGYFEFLNRVHTSESRIQHPQPHPWLNLFIPRGSIAEFNELVLEQVLRDGINGPLLLYPLDRVKWDLRMSAVTPDEDTFYLVGMLRYASVAENNVGKLVEENEDILSVCESVGIGYKQYLPHYTSEIEWRKHYGISRWNTLVKRKSQYDPQAILSTGQRIFTRRQRHHHRPSSLTNSINLRTAVS